MRLRCTFFDYDGFKILPTGVELRIYDRERTLIGGPMPVEPDSEGSYEAYYTVPGGVSEIAYEFSGADEAGRPVAARAVTNTAWA